MTKEKKKLASLKELRNGSGLLLLFSPLVAFAYFALLSGLYYYFFVPNWFPDGERIPAVAIGLAIPLFIMTYVLLRYVVRWRRLALFIKRVRDEYFRFIRMQENADDTERLVEESSDDADIDPYRIYEDEQQRGLSQS